MRNREGEAGDGIGLRLSRLQGKNTTFYRVIKTTRRVSKTTPNTLFGVRFGVRSGSPQPFRWRYLEIIERSFQANEQRVLVVEAQESEVDVLHSLACLD